MKRRIADLVKMGVLVPVLIVSMAACGAASAQNKGDEAAGAAQTAQGEAVEEKTEETATQPAEAKVYEN